MSALVSRFEPGQEQLSAEQPCRVAVLYEDSRSRDRAMGLCHRLVKRFWEDIEFELTWWKFKFLQDPAIACLAAQEAAKADLVLISVVNGDDLPFEVKGWMEMWLVPRRVKEGSLIALVGPLHECSAGASPVAFYLRTLAKRAGVEFFSTLPAATGTGREDLRRILPQQETSPTARSLAWPPPVFETWGINE